MIDTLIEELGYGKRVGNLIDLSSEFEKSFMKMEFNLYKK